MRSLLLTAVMLGLAPAARAAEITPESFKRMSRMSLDISRLYKRHVETSSAERHSFLTELDALETSRRSYTAPTVLGPVTVSPLQLELAVTGSWKDPSDTAKKKVNGIFVLASSLDLQIDDSRHTDLTSENGPYGDLYGWDYGTILAGLEYGLGTASRLAFGVLVREHPKVVRSAEGRDLFSFSFDRGEDKNTTSERRYLPFFDGEAAGVRVMTLGLDSVDLSVPVSGALRASLVYFSYGGIVRAGASWLAESRERRLRLSGEAYFTALRSGGRPGLANALASSELRLLGPREPERLNLSLETGLSYSRELFDHGITGWYGGLYLENLRFFKTYSRLGMGLSSGYQQAAARLPVRSETLISFYYRVTY